MVGRGNIFQGVGVGATEYEFVVVQMSKINAHVPRFFHLNSEQCTTPKGD